MFMLYNILIPRIRKLNFISIDRCTYEQVLHSIHTVLYIYIYIYIYIHIKCTLYMTCSVHIYIYIYICIHIYDKLYNLYICVHIRSIYTYVCKFIHSYIFTFVWMLWVIHDLYVSNATPLVRVLMFSLGTAPFDPTFLHQYHHPHHKST